MANEKCPNCGRPVARCYVEIVIVDAEQLQDFTAAVEAVERAAADMPWHAELTDAAQVLKRIRDEI